MIVKFSRASNVVYASFREAAKRNKLKSADIEQACATGQVYGRCRWAILTYPELTSTKRTDHIEANLKKKVALLNEIATITQQLFKLPLTDVKAAHRAISQLAKKRARKVKDADSATTTAAGRPRRNRSSEIRE